MARGGMYDQLGGGFHRYSVDERWLVPHFEKMLYDNALLTTRLPRSVAGHPRPVLRADRRRDARLRAAGDDRARAARSTRTQDADSEGEEGKFYVWSEKEIRDVLGPDLGEFAVQGLGRHRARQLRGAQHPLPRADATRRTRRRSGCRVEDFRGEARRGEAEAATRCGRSASGRAATRRS